MQNTGNIHQGHLHKGFPQERDGDHDKPEFGQPQEEILMLVFGISFLVIYSYLH